MLVLTRIIGEKVHIFLCLVYVLRRPRGTTWEPVDLTDGVHASLFWVHV